MRRWLARGVAGGLLALAGAALWVRLLGGGPVLDPVPGGALRGELASEPPRDWSFAATQRYLDVESRAGWLPYSGSFWFMVYQGRPHVILPSFFGDGLQRRLARDPRVRVRIDGRLYEQLAVRIDDPTALGALLAPLLRRQFAVEIAGAVRPVAGARAAETWIYRLDDPPRAPGAAP
jgi:hypothetical protein